jgi:hypothetical protein
MTPQDFSGEADAMLRRALLSFAGWAADNWTMTEDEARTLTIPTACPAEFARGYKAAIEGISDAMQLWLEGEL